MSDIPATRCDYIELDANTKFLIENGNPVILYNVIVTRTVFNVIDLVFTDKDETENLFAITTVPAGIVAVPLHLICSNGLKTPVGAEDISLTILCRPTG